MSEKKELWREVQRIVRTGMDEEDTYQSIVDAVSRELLREDEPVAYQNRYSADGEWASCHRSLYEDHTGYAVEWEWRPLYIRPAPKESASWRHSANEWADTAINAAQWIKNIRDGISTPEQALDNLEVCIVHCQEVGRAAAQKENGK